MSQPAMIHECTPTLCYEMTTFLLHFIIPFRLLDVLIEFEATKEENKFISHFIFAILFRYGWNADEKHFFIHSVPLQPFHFDYFNKCLHGIFEFFSWQFSNESKKKQKKKKKKQATKIDAIHFVPIRNANRIL